jgi:hypothetical protein
MTSTLADSPPAGPAPLITREDAVKFLAGGHTALGLLTTAAHPATVRSVAGLSGKTQQEVRAELLALSAGVGRLEAEGLTPAQCRVRLGLGGIYVAAQRGGLT